MADPTSTVHLERSSDFHLEGITALYNDPAVARQVAADAVSVG